MLTVTKDGEIYEFETKLQDGTPMKNRFNYSLYRKYREARTESRVNTRLHDHPMLGKAFKRDDGVIGIIEVVSKHWWFGYYEHIVYRIHNTRSHGTGVYRNLSCVCQSIIEMAAEFSKYQILQDHEVPDEVIQLEK